MDPPAYTPAMPSKPAGEPADLPELGATSAPSRAANCTLDVRAQVQANALILVSHAAAQKKIRCLMPSQTQILMGKIDSTNLKPIIEAHANMVVMRKSSSTSSGKDSSTAGPSSSRAAHEDSSNNNGSGDSRKHYAFIVYVATEWLRAGYKVYMAGEACDTAGEAMENLLEKTEEEITEIYTKNSLPPSKF